MKKVLSCSFLILSIAVLGWPSLNDITDVKGSLSRDSKIGSRLSAGVDVVKAATLDDKDISNYASQYAAWSDKKNKVAPASSSYAQRLEKLTKKHIKEDGLKLDFKVYLSPEINAFSLANGTIRINSGLMDAMNDDELLSVIGHEIGHVKLGHSKSRFRTAYLASAARKVGTSAVGGGALKQLAANELGSLGEDLVKAQFSQDNEKDADDYGLKFMKRNKYNPAGAGAALRKIAEKGGGKGGLLATHPDPMSRAKRLDKQL